jgi:hypothetical protein
MASPSAAVVLRHTIVTSVRARAHELVTYLAVRDNQISTGLISRCAADIWEGGTAARVSQKIATLASGEVLLTLAKSKRCGIQKFVFSVFVYLLPRAPQISNTRPVFLTH